MTNPLNSTSLLTAPTFREWMTDLPGGGGFAWHKQELVDDIVEEVKQRGDASTLASRSKLSRRLVGTVPNLVALNWAKEWGVPLHSREWMQKARARVMHDPNWKKLRVDHQK